MIAAMHVRVTSVERVNVPAANAGRSPHAHDPPVADTPRLVHARDVLPLWLGHDDGQNRIAMTKIPPTM